MNPETDMEVAGFNISLGTPTNDIPEGFNEHGVRENYDGDDLESIDVIFDAMEPGVRKGIEIEPEFLQGLANDPVQGLPVQYDHSHSQRANVGNLTDAKFDDRLKFMLNIPNTGSQIRTDTIADFTHSTGPQITDGSVGFNPQSLEFGEPESEDAKAKFENADLIEFSLTPFPAGYENGGITAEFSQAVDSFVDSEQSAESQLYKSQMR